MQPCQRQKQFDEPEIITISAKPEFLCTGYCANMDGKLQYRGVISMKNSLFYAPPEKQSGAVFYLGIENALAASLREGRDSRFNLFIK